MNKLLIIAVLLSLGRPAAAHRLDEFLQATIISLGEDRVEASMRLTPGVAVSSIVLANIDTNGDAALSETEQRAYAERVLDDLSLTADGVRLALQLSSMSFPSVTDIKEGVGDILIEFTATLPPGRADRRLVFENQHHSRIATYLANCLVPDNPNIRIVGQHRNEQQSIYQLDYHQAATDVSAQSL